MADRDRGPLLWQTDFLPSWFRRKLEVQCKNFSSWGRNLRQTRNIQGLHWHGHQLRNHAFLLLHHSSKLADTVLRVWGKLWVIELALIWSKYAWWVRSSGSSDILLAATNRPLLVYVFDQVSACHILQLLQRGCGSGHIFPDELLHSLWFEHFSY